jgi:hypothetical protein
MEKIQDIQDFLQVAQAVEVGHQVRLIVQVLMEEAVEVLEITQLLVLTQVRELGLNYIIP